MKVRINSRLRQIKMKTCGIDINTLTLAQELCGRCVSYVGLRENCVSYARQQI